MSFILFKHFSFFFCLINKVNAIGEHGFQLFVDAGQSIDSDLVQALVREVLEEKISTMIGNNKLFENGVDNNELPKLSARTQPQPTPRNIERNSNENLKLNLNQVETPLPTPTQSPLQSPKAVRRPITPVITPQQSVIEDAKVPFEPRVVPRVIEIDDETESWLETASNHEEEGMHIQLYLLNFYF